MNYRLMGRFIGRILLIEDVFFIPALIISICYHEKKTALSFLVVTLFTFLVGALLLLFCRKAKDSFHAKEGLVCVGLSWFFISLFGCLPFYFSREIPAFIDALFETVSGFTTTGASILPEVESMSKGLLYWRSFTHWLGGMGVLVFLLALDNAHEKNNGYTMHLLRAESPGPTVGKLVPKMKTTARILYLLYISLTILDFIFLLFGHMSVFEALCTALGTAGTGGFGVRNDSIASYSPYIQNVCTVFMFLFGVNFNCYFLILIGQAKSLFKDEELRMYILVALGSILAIAYNIRGIYDTVGETFRHAAFQVSSIMTTTGFATTDFDQWPETSRTILICLMMLGASAGSTGGGFKCGRFLLVIKSLRRSIRQFLHPEKVQVIKMNGRMVGEKTIHGVYAFLAAYVCLSIVTFLVLSLDGFSTVTNFTAVLACLNNIGPGLDAVGPTCNFAAFSILSKIALIINMLAGRLEIFPILILFSRSTWRKR